MTSIKVQIVQLFNKSATSIHSKLFDLLINLLIELPHQPTLLKINKNGKRTTTINNLGA
jgi:hypothetical protein